jgi:hypothetical protein
MKGMNWKVIAHWAVTALFAGLMLLSASMYLSGSATIRDAIAHLGYPGYLLSILGIAKLFGAIALMQNRLPTLREWAYAGFAINLIGASVSHLFAGDPLSVALVPTMFLVPLSVSYLLRPERRAYAAGHVGRTAPAAA